jgi:monofunctional biosynthetic peptidoglycan transglycosylase
MQRIAETERIARVPRRRLLKVAILFACLLLLVPLLLILVYRFVDPPYSALMARQRLAGKTITQTWVMLERISPHLVAAVVTSEDARFCHHWGVDWLAIEEALYEPERSDRGPRGASTIPMQTAKNLFLWSDRNYVRKALEMPLAYAMDFLWPKRRMLEIYLNIAEWGPGIFGAEAASRHHFGKRALDLSTREAALLAAALPNPFVRRAGHAGPRTRTVASRIEARMKGADPWLGCLDPD